MRKILVVGGGIAGPAFCLFCKKFGIEAEITLAERAPEFRNVGFAISLWGNGRKILNQLDLVKNIDDKLGYEIPWDAVETPTHRIIKSFYFDVFRKAGPIVSITRSALQLGLVRAMEKENISIRLNSPVKIVSNDANGVMAQLGESAPEHFDLVVAADGIHSTTRESVFGPGKLKPYNVAIWTMWVPDSFSHPRGYLHIIKSGKVSLLFPVADRAYLLLSAKDHSAEIELPEKRKETLLKVFAGHNDEILEMIKAVEKPETIMRDNLAHVEMDEWFKDRVVLLGDAQHALSPATGMGASLALEDAFVLADELKKIEDIDQALSAYAKRRGPRVEVVKMFSKNIDSWMFATGLKELIRNTMAAFVPFNYFTRGFIEFLTRDI